MSRLTDHDHRDVASATVADAIYSRLRDDILAGQLRPGSLLRQDELARRFGASRVPLREAMTRLEAEGLLLLRPRRGYAVLSLASAEIQEIFDLRAVVEEHLAAFAARSRSDADLARIEAELLRMEAIADEAVIDARRWLEANASFHANLLGAAQRRHASRLAGRLRDQVEPYIRIEIDLTREVVEAQTEHRLMLEALKRRDETDLSRLCRQHCEQTAARLINALTARAAAS